MFESLSVGLLVSIFWAGLGYAVAKSKNAEPFDPLKFVKTLVIGIILSSASSGLGIEVATLEGMSVVGFLTVVVDKVTSLLVRKA